MPSGNPAVDMNLTWLSPNTCGGHLNPAVGCQDVMILKNVGIKLKYFLAICHSTSSTSTQIVQHGPML
jgi:hypothetical protein